MRKLLLAGAAMLGGMVGLAAVASAQNAPWNTLDTAAPPTGTLPVARNGSPGAPGTDIPGFGPPLAPGTVTVRFAGRLVVFGGAGADSGQNPGYVLGTRTSPGTLANTKLAPYGIGEYARLFPSVDGVAANGLKYGAFLEVRADQSGAPGGGANGSVGGAQSTRGELYFWRETAYVGTGQTGFLRAGATDQPTSLFETGTFENFDDGGWNANFAFPITSGTQITGPFTDLSALYATNKVVYLSPKFANLVDFGVSFAPDTGSASPGIGACPYANTASGVGCDTTSSTSVAAETKRARNTLDAVVRLRAAAGPVGFAATAGGFASGHVAYDGIEPASQAARYNGYAVFDTGAQLTYGGFAIGGHFNAGQTNTGWSLQPQGGRAYAGWLAGASYQFGAAVVGFQVLNTQGAGAWNSTNAGLVGRTLNQSGVAAGGTLTLAPGLYTFASYLYGTKHEYGVDQLAAAVPTSATGSYLTHNNTVSQAFVVGTRVAW